LESPETTVALPPAAISGDGSFRERTEKERVRERGESKMK
jgi:hypothetical protein